jgi:hypothetical protein
VSLAVCRFAAVLFLALVPLLGAAPARAQVEGACVVAFNGVAADRIGTLDSPLELEASDTLVFAGSSETGTLEARVRLLMGPITVASGATSYTSAQAEFGATVRLDEVAPYGVGLFRVVAEADGCVAQAWVRVSGRFPLATLTGLAALGITLGGITGQLGAIVSRSRWSRSAAALGGIPTGLGLALLAQQFGRLQVSYPSVAIVVAIMAVLGFVAASYLNPALHDERVGRRRTMDAGSADARAITGVATAVEPIAGPPAVPATVPRPGRPGPPHLPDGPGSSTDPYWCYVLAPIDLFDLTDHTTTVAMLVPGTWYLAKRTVAGWAHIVVPDGEEGWVARSAIHRQG